MWRKSRVPRGRSNVAPRSAWGERGEEWGALKGRSNGWVTSGDGVCGRLDRPYRAHVICGRETQGGARASLCLWATLVCPFGAGTSRSKENLATIVFQFFEGQRDFSGWEGSPSKEEVHRHQLLYKDSLVGSFRSFVAIFQGYHLWLIFLPACIQLV